MVPKLPRAARRETLDPCYVCPVLDYPRHALLRTNVTTAMHLRRSLRHDNRHRNLPSFGANARGRSKFHGHDQFDVEKSPQYANFYFILITNLIMNSKFPFPRGKYQGIKLGSFQVITRLKIRSFSGVLNFEEKMSNNGSVILTINF